METIEFGTKRFWMAASALFSGGFVTFAILYSTQPLLPVFSQTFRISPASSSLTLSLTTGTLALALILSAIVSGHWGRKPIMGWSLLLSSCLSLLLGLSTNFNTLLELRVIQGLALAGLPSIAMAYVAEEFSPKSLGMIMGLYVSGTTIGGMFGRIVIGIVSDYFSWRVALSFVGAISILFSFWFWVALPASSHFQRKKLSIRTAGQSFWKQLKHPRLLCLFTMGFLLMGGFVTLFNYIGYQLTGAPYQLSQSTVSWIFIVYLCGTFSSAWMGQLADLKGKRVVLTCGMGTMLAGLMITLCPQLWLKIVGTAIFTFGFFGSHSITSGWVGKLSGEYKAHASSLYLLFYYAGSSIVGTFGGTVWHRLQWDGIVGLIALCIGISLLLELFLTEFTVKKHHIWRHVH